VKISRTCDKCQGTGKITRELSAGDIVVPRDGSGMPQGLHHVLWNGLGSIPSFNPVKILHIEGNAMFVTPVDWKGKCYDTETYSAQSWMEIDGKGVDGFWIYAPHCHLGI